MDEMLEELNHQARIVDRLFIAFIVMVTIAIMLMIVVAIKKRVEEPVIELPKCVEINSMEYCQNE